MDEINLCGMDKLEVYNTNAISVNRGYKKLLVLEDDS